MKNELVHRARIPEPDLGLLRVDVDVDTGGIDLQEQAVSRVTAAMQQVLVGLTHGMAEQFVADETAIHVAVLGIAARARIGRQRAVAGNVQRTGLDVETARFEQKILAKLGKKDGSMAWGYGLPF